MEKYAWKAKIRPGTQEEYIRRHNALWPELAEALTAAGIENYTIWMTGDELFGYYECAKGVAYACEFQKNSPVVQRWEEHMKDILLMELDPVTGAQPSLTPVFHFNER